MPRDREKGNGIKLIVRTQNQHRCPKVRSLRCLGVNLSEGIRQNSPVTLVQGVPAVVMYVVTAGYNNKGCPTV